MKNLYTYLKEELATPLNTMGMGNIDPGLEPLIGFNKSVTKKKSKKHKKNDPEI
jgi:hypothetical protein